MLNIYLNISFRENLTFPKFRFSKLKKLFSWSVIGELQLLQIAIEFQTFLLQMESQMSGSKGIMTF